MSRPTTPLGLSPRGSFVNLADAAGNTNPIRDEKERIRAELLVQAQLQSQSQADEEKAKKEEIGMPVASPGMSPYLRRS